MVSQIDEQTELINDTGIYKQVPSCWGVTLCALNFSISIQWEYESHHFKSKLSMSIYITHSTTTSKFP